MIATRHDHNVLAAIFTRWCHRRIAVHDTIAATIERFNGEQGRERGMDIERDNISWRQILVSYGVVLLVFAAMVGALLSTRMPQQAQIFELALAGSWSP
jgi:hypothetical protein